jgi:hypothetical protein
MTHLTQEQVEAIAPESLVLALTPTLPLTPVTALILPGVDRRIAVSDVKGLDSAMRKQSCYAASRPGSSA